MKLGMKIGSVAQLLGFDLSGSSFSLRVKRAPLKRQLFPGGQTLTWDPSGYWSVSPMPTEAALEKYYRDEYWQARGDQLRTVNPRDLSHFFQLVDADPRILSKKGHLLNFGAGHGGLSHVFWGLGWTVWNVEPGPKLFEGLDRWNQVKSLDEIPEMTRFDILYSSNTFEHLTQIDRTLSLMNCFATDESTWFVEVPDSSGAGFGGRDGTIQPPHTLYFTPTFFKNIFGEESRVTSIAGSGLFSDPANYKAYEVIHGRGDSLRCVAHGVLDAAVLRKPKF